MTRNEAAEQLIANAMKYGLIDIRKQTDAALAEERRHVIEQIRERIADFYTRSDSNAENHPGVFAILDDLSTPEQDR